MLPRARARGHESPESCNGRFWSASLWRPASHSLATGRVVRRLDLETRGADGACWRAEAGRTPTFGLRLADEEAARASKACSS
jgi:hypothetical protein